MFVHNDWDDFRFKALQVPLLNLTIEERLEQTVAEFTSTDLDMVQWFYGSCPLQSFHHSIDSGCRPKDDVDEHIGDCIHLQLGFLICFRMMYTDWTIGQFPERS